MSVQRRELASRETDIVEKLFDFDRYGLTATERFNMRLTAGLLINEQREEINRLLAALKFYADPFAWKALHDPEDAVQIPDFYSETGFGDTAVDAIAPPVHANQGAGR